MVRRLFLYYAPGLLALILFAIVAADDLHRIASRGDAPIEDARVAQIAVAPDAAPAAQSEREINRKLALSNMRDSRGRLLTTDSLEYEALLARMYVEMTATPGALRESVLMAAARAGDYGAETFAGSGAFLAGLSVDEQARFCGLMGAEARGGSPRLFASVFCARYD